jgi:hypothetical protein
VGALVVILVAVGLILWLALRDTGVGSKSTPGSVSAVSVAQLQALAASRGQPIYWVGPKPGYTYELTRESNGYLIVHYLPPGVKVGSPRPYLAVATYPFRGALNAIQIVSKGKGNASFAIPGGGRAEYKISFPQSIHLAYPGVDYQVEVYDPTPGAAKAIVRSGQVSALGKQKSRPTTPPVKPVAASVVRLRALAKSLGHPLYWVGPRAGYTYELTEATNGNVYIRYLPPGVGVGAHEPYLAVGTYPFPHAFSATQALTKQKGAETITLARGGIAVVSKADPTSIHLAYPGSDYQVEVFDPSAAVARRVVSSGQLTTIG